PARTPGRRSGPGDRVPLVRPQDDHGDDDRADPRDAVVREDELPEESAEDGAHDPDQDRHEGVHLLLPGRIRRASTPITAPTPTYQRNRKKLISASIPRMTLSSSSGSAAPSYVSLSFRDRSSAARPPWGLGPAIDPDAERHEN